MLLVVGAEVANSGVYRVTHREHRGSHEVVIHAGEFFPTCYVCGDQVEFEFVRPLIAPVPAHITADPDFS